MAAVKFRFIFTYLEIIDCNMNQYETNNLNLIKYKSVK